MVVRVVHPWWDASVYQSMARYIASGGLYGTWEMFRPPLWPLILSIFSGLGPITLEWIAKIITLILSLGIIYLVYRIGEKIMPWVGVIASALISISAPLLTFSVVPMTEIPSLFLITLAIYYFIENKYFLTGIITGLACIMRFP
ncbi:MAG TPA: glycosyltransferase family 39 protein, partial [Candidatus Paceibacterota bacterium]|nr:glycosyltransferase family 39 protein [Candidatus Paceibacterota bacterium]